MVEETLVFVDEGFLSRLSKYFGNGKYIKFDKIDFVKNLAKKKNLFVKHIFYAIAPPFQSGKPTEDEKRRKEGYDKFKSKFSNKKDFTILEGRCQRIKDKDGKVCYHQKGVDTVMTMALSSFRADFSTIKKIILIACDSDFVPVIKMLREKGIEVILFSYYERVRDTEFSRSHHLIDACSECVQLTKDDLENSKLE
jgi:uncharacterized LabA/DUF88 family protein